MPDPIRLRGVRQNNLKGIDLDLPYDALTVVTGVSGCGKSSLVFDTVFAEGQRRYVESFSAYARQFLERMPRPDADLIDGLPPAVAVEQSNPVRTSRSTVGTMTELTDHLKLLFARVATLHCPTCDREVARETAEDVADAFDSLAAGARVSVTFPLPDAAGLPWKDQVGGLAAGGLGRLLDRDSGRVSDATAVAERPDGEVLVVVDRVVAGSTDRGRVLDSVEQALRLGHGNAVLHVRDGEALRFSTGLHCAVCDTAFRDPQPNLFSFNSPLGACSECKGFGRTLDVDPSAVVPDHSRPLGRAIRPWTTPRTRRQRAMLAEYAEERGVELDTPWSDLPEDVRRGVFDGDDGYPGVRGWMRALESKAYKMRVRVLLSRYRMQVRCEVCDGTRRTPEALRWRVGGRNVFEWEQQPIGDSLAALRALELPASTASVAADIRAAIEARLSFLDDVGLGYLTLDRATRTLSGGEFQRVNLATALGAALVNTLYVLDEPSVGLHPRDTHRLLSLLRQLRDRGNTLLVVEHDPDTIRAADHVVDLGPGAGEHGGTVLFTGSPAELEASDASRTAEFLSGRREVAERRAERRTATGRLQLHGCTGRELRNVDLDIPTGCLVAVVGVSGSGKSSLVADTLVPAVKQALGASTPAPLPHSKLTGWEMFSRCDVVDQTPIGRTPRSNPTTYSGAATPLRSLMAMTPIAKKLRLRPKSFSFNTRGGRCPSCEGAGVEVLEMQFLADVQIPCEDCDGKRFRDEVLLATYRGLNISEILELPVDEAIAFFDPDVADAELGARARKSAASVRAKIRPLADVGLGYLRLGQSATTLSGGEAQRLKLAGYVGRVTGKRGGRARRTLYVLDEPTTGLHLHDVSVLLRCLSRLADVGHTVVVIEHHMGVVAAADHVIEIGPGGGRDGGEIVAIGTPEEIASGDTATATFLAREVAP